MATSVAEAGFCWQPHTVSHKDDRLLYLDRLHATVDRLATQAFVIKSLSISITCAFATMAMNHQGPDRLLICTAAISATLVLWALNTQFLRTERAVRNIIEAIRLGRETTLFAWNVATYRQSLPTLRTATSWSLIWLYAMQMIIISAIAATGVI